MSLLTKNEVFIWGDNIGGTPWPCYGYDIGFVRSLESAGAPGLQPRKAGSSWRSMLVTAKRTVAVP